MGSNKKSFLLMFGLLFMKLICAQSGGPPMLTDDPGVVDLHKWEINSSITLTKDKQMQVGFPYLDINYGILRNLQLKIESPYIFTFEKSRKVSGTLGDIMVGVKYRLLDEDKSFLSAGVYPQLTIRGDKGFLFPLLLEKTFGKFLIGDAIGHFWGDQNSFQNGLLLGYQIYKQTQLMGEYFLEKEYQLSKESSGYINFGFRHTLTPVFTLMGSIGTQIKTPAGEQREYLISFLGIQSSF